MNLQDLLVKGYFPKELPPCFMTELFGTNIIKLLQMSRQMKTQLSIKLSIKSNSDRAIIAADKEEDKN